jgi:hypothetical protein
MSYFIRYIITQGSTTLAHIDAALQAADASFRIQIDPGDGDTGDLYYGEEVLGEISIDGVGGTVFNEDIEELRELLAPLNDPMRPLIQTALDNAQNMVALHVLEAGHNNPDILDTLWDWMFSHHPGLLQVDDEGFYDYDGLVLSTVLDEGD